MHLLELQVVLGIHSHTNSPVAWEKPSGEALVEVEVEVEQAVVEVEPVRVEVEPVRVVEEQVQNQKIATPL